MITFDYNSYKSKAFNRRVNFIILHYTAGNFADSIKTLTGNSVSTHYLVPNMEDKTYINAGFNEMRIFNLVDESDKAWHAGSSYWEKKLSLNDTSIGIEIVNKASFRDGKFTFPPYPSSQIEALVALLQNILHRHPDIPPTNIIGHSDIAPGRKSDPGPSFPWKKLNELGIGAWYNEYTKNRLAAKYSKYLPDRNIIIEMLDQYGYDISNATKDTGFKDLIRAFQLHFRPNNYNGVLDTETVAILAALIEKYKKTTE